MHERIAVYAQYVMLQILLSYVSEVKNINNNNKFCTTHFFITYNIHNESDTPELLFLSDICICVENSTNTSVYIFQALMRDLCWHNIFCRSVITKHDRGKIFLHTLPQFRTTLHFRIPTHYHSFCLSYCNIILRICAVAINRAKIIARRRTKQIDRTC